METLIPLSDYVLLEEQKLLEIYENGTTKSDDVWGRGAFIVRVTNYARFLKMPLTLDMFIGNTIMLGITGENILFKDFYYDKISNCLVYKNSEITIQTSADGSTKFTGVNYSSKDIPAFQLNIIEDLLNFEGVKLTSFAMQMLENR